MGYPLFNRSLQQVRARFRILLIDSNSEVQQSAVGVMSAKGYSVRSSRSTAVAARYLRRHPVDLIIYSTCTADAPCLQSAAKLLSIRPDADIVLIADEVAYDYFEDVIRLQPIALLKKPLRTGELLLAVNRCFSSRLQTKRWEQKMEELREAVANQSRELEFQKERLLAEKQLISEIIASANFGLIAVDLSSDIHMLNAFAVKLLNLPQDIIESFHGINLSAVLPQSTADRVLPIIEKVRQSGTLFEQDISMPDLKAILNVVAYPLTYREEPTGFVLIVHDKTEQDSLQRRLLHTAKLASIGELAAGVAHEINNPLGFVISNSTTLQSYCEVLSSYIDKVETLLKSRDPKGAQAIPGLRQDLDIDYTISDAKVLIDETLMGLHRVSRIVRDLKTFARPDGDVKEVADINKLLDDSLTLTRNELKYKVDVKTDFRELPEILCYPSQLIQVFTNLLVNAVQAIQEHGVIRVATRASDENILVTIEDTGCGIPGEQLSRIFDPFFTTKEPGHGTGMGLSISYGIIEKHEGTIAVESQTGVGSKFTIRLPANPKRMDQNRQVEVISEMQS